MYIDMHQLREVIEENSKPNDEFRQLPTIVVDWLKQLEIIEKEKIVLHYDMSKWKTMAENLQHLVYAKEVRENTIEKLKGTDGYVSVPCEYDFPDDEKRSEESDELWFNAMVAFDNAVRGSRGFSEWKCRMQAAIKVLASGVK